MQRIGSILADSVPGLSDTERMEPKEISAPPKFMAVGIDPWWGFGIGIEIRRA